MKSSSEVRSGGTHSPESVVSVREGLGDGSCFPERDGVSRNDFLFLDFVQVEESTCRGDPGGLDRFSWEEDSLFQGSKSFERR